MDSAPTFRTKHIVIRGLEFDKDVTHFRGACSGETISGALNRDTSVLATLRAVTPDNRRWIGRVTLRRTGEAERDVAVVFFESGHSLASIAFDGMLRAFVYEFLRHGPDKFKRRILGDAAKETEP